MCKEIKDFVLHTFFILQEISTLTSLEGWRIFPESDAICMEKPAGDIYAAAYPDLVIADYVVADAAGGVAFPAAKGQDDLIAFINETIEELKASGELEKLYQEACAQAIDQLGE